MKNLNKLAKVNFKYVTVRKSKCVTEEVKISYKALETIVEMGRDYIELLKKDIEESRCEGYKKALYQYKINEIGKISTTLADSIGYCKGCSIRRNKKDDIETDIVVLMSMSKEERDRM